MADEVAELTAAVLQNAAIIGDFYRALHDQHLPENLIHELVSDYHREALLLGYTVIIGDDD